MRKLKQDLFSISTILIMLLLHACSIQQNVNIEALYNLKLEQDIETIKDLFSEFDVVVSDGIHVNSDVKNSWGLKEWLKAEYRQTDGEYILDTVFSMDMSIDLYLFYNTKDAQLFFNGECSSTDNNKKKVDLPNSIKGEKNNQYYISGLEKIRSPEFYVTMYHKSYVLFQKRNLVIVIREYSQFKRNGRKDDFIKSIAKTLK